MANNKVVLSVENLLEWFNNNYEDAVHGVFYNGCEGGYQFAAIEFSREGRFALPSPQPPILPGVFRFPSMQPILCQTTNLSVV
jgi:hypothetical protein